jgi:hypothetical protein
MLVAAIIIGLAIYAFREQLWDFVIAMWKDDQPDK